MVLMLADALYIFPSPVGPCLRGCVYLVMIYFNDIMNRVGEDPDHCLVAIKVYLLVQY